jgi:uncharacterized DUF497 family protein
MKLYNWNVEKNNKLKTERGLCFEDIMYHIEKGHVLEIIEHPDRKKYRNQKIYLINIDNYVYLIPFIETEKEIFLKTIIPSRKATKKYLEH